MTQDSFKALIDLIRVHFSKEDNCVISVFKLKFFSREVLDDDGFQPKQFKYCSVCQGLAPSIKQCAAWKVVLGNGKRLLISTIFPSNINWGNFFKVSKVAVKEKVFWNVVLLPPNIFGKFRKS